MVIHNSFENEEKDTFLDNHTGIDHLENLIKQDGIVSYNPDCVRKKSNWSKKANKYLFDKLEFEPEELLKDIPTHSPKLETLLKKIESLDARDQKKYGKKFKHFIFSDLKSGSYGVKLLASALIAKGMHLGYTAKAKKGAKIQAESASSNESNESSSDDDDSSEDEDEEEDGPELNLVSLGKIKKQNGGEPKKQKQFEKIELLSESDLKKHPKNNFFMLSSVAVYDQPISVAMKKSILQTFNSRPDNIYGELARIIIMDSGFKEGIDLFDIKYVHIFEPSVVGADQKQVIGRGTRTCGQKGLDFHPTQGWPLHVFIYDLELPNQIQSQFLDTKTAFDLYVKAMNLDIRLFHFAHDLEKATIIGSVDHDLNLNVHSFAVPDDDGDEGDEGEYIYGGKKDKELEIAALSSALPMEGGSHQKYKLKIREPKQEPEPEFPDMIKFNMMNHLEMREHIADHFSEYEWPPVKMENLCASKQSGGAGEVIKYTPSQDFIKNYFTTRNPLRGMLLNWSVGTGKTCAAIAAATNTFEKENYTILWVTRTTLKNDIWKNMFDQVCNESIRNKIQNSDLKIPADQNKRMRLLSKSWKIRPMSYKQFSNLVSKQNNFYKDLVKINGEVDPLRKTLLIIDEAHKLYGGGDLSSIERPDMKKLHQALMHSYQISGKDSVKLLLMTATPITQNPLELIQLINLCKPMDQQMPIDFDSFSADYLNEQGQFTNAGQTRYLDDIAGYVSYLNREKDARQFSQPQVQMITTPIVKNTDMIEKYDKKMVKAMKAADVSDLKSKILEKQELLKGELSDLDPKRFYWELEKSCANLGEKKYKQCEKVVKQNIRELVNEAKEEVKRIRDEIKEIKEAMKDRKGIQQDALKEIRKNQEINPEQFAKYKDSALYTLKNKCAVRVSSRSNLMDIVDEHPVIQKFNDAIKANTDKIVELRGRLNEDVLSYKNRINHLKALLRKDLAPLERSVINMTLKEDKVTQSKILKLKAKDTTKTEKGYNALIKDAQKSKKKYIQIIRKTIKKKIMGEKKQSAKDKREEKKLRKTLRKEGIVKEEIKHELLQGLVEKYKEKVSKDLGYVNEQVLQKEHAKEDAKARKQQAKEDEKARKQQAKEAEKSRKLAEREHTKQTKKLETEQKRKEKEALRKTKKK